jgi:hypothetical protein
LATTKLLLQKPNKPGTKTLNPEKNQTLPILNYRPGTCSENQNGACHDDGTRCYNGQKCKAKKKKKPSKKHIIIRLLFG